MRRPERPCPATSTAHGYRVDEAGDAAEALRRWDAERPDIVLLDLGLPDLDGVAVVRRIRRDATTPILVLSARDDERDKVAALEAGADDYVTKPFGMDELRARVGALLRRAGGPAAATDGIVTLGPIVIDIGARRVTVGGRELDLTPREYELLKVMAGQPGRLLTRGACSAPCGAARTPTKGTTCTSTSAGFAASSRRPIRSGSARGFITAEPGVGYRIGEARARLRRR